MNGGGNPGQEVRWTWAWGRARLRRLRSLVLPFEVRREGSGSTAELWIHAGQRHHRWRIPIDSLCAAAPPPRVVAAELRPLPIGGNDAPRGERWDVGICEILDGEQGGASDPFYRGVAQGELLVTLRGDRLRGSFRLQRTALAMAGEPQWLLWWSEAPRPVRESS